MTISTDLETLPEGWFVSSEAGLVHGVILAETEECWFVLIREKGLPIRPETTPTSPSGLTLWTGIVRLSKANTTKMPDSEGWV